MVEHYLKCQVGVKKVKQKGFTLIELLVVVAIIGILARWETILIQHPKSNINIWAHYGHTQY
jgi:prepilin-type N-terminal cleavage/methylation domain-containing protein